LKYSVKIYKTKVVMAQFGKEPRLAEGVRPLASACFYPEGEEEGAPAIIVIVTDAEGHSKMSEDPEIEELTEFEYTPP